MSDNILTWQYVAGFFDGEGTVNCKVEGSLRRFRLAIYQCDREVLDDIAFFLSVEGIASAVAMTRPGNEAHRASHTLTVSGARNVYKMLTKLDGLVIVKRDDVNVAIEWLWDLAEKAEAGELHHSANAAYSGIRS